METVEVQGSRAEVRKKVEAFVASVTSKEGSLIGRWEKRICPMIVGVSDDQAAFIRHRLLEVEAETRRKKVDDAHACQPNLFVIVTDEPDKVLDDWKARDPSMFRWKLREGITRSTGDGPVRTWHNAVEVGTGSSNPRIENPAIEFIRNVVVLVDATRTGGKSIAQLSDYLALVTLSQIDASADSSSVQSILQLFSSTAQTAPPALTEWDRALLHGLYRISYSPAYQRQDLRARMNRELAPRKRRKVETPQEASPVVAASNSSGESTTATPIDASPPVAASIETPAYAGRGVDPTKVTPTANNPVDTVVVQGSRAEVRKQVESFVAKVTRTDGELIGRWRDSLCPLVAGLSDAQNAFVRNRLLEVEAKVRKRAAQPDRKCNPNVFVIVTDDADGVLAQWKERDSKSMFLWKTREDLLRADEAGPVRIWHNAVVLRSDDGPWVYQNLGAKRAVKQGRLKDSRIVASAKEAISAVVVLLDSKKMGKVNLAQTSDYLAMVSLSQVDLKADVAATNTILKLFSEPETGLAPTGLTEWDYAFLNALYRVGYYSPMHQRMDLAARMSRELAPR